MGISIYIIPYKLLIIPYKLSTLNLINFWHLLKMMLLWNMQPCTSSTIYLDAPCLVWYSGEYSVAKLQKIHDVYLNSSRKGSWILSFSFLPTAIGTSRLLLVTGWLEDPMAEAAHSYFISPSNEPIWTYNTEWWSHPQTWKVITRVRLSQWVSSDQGTCSPFTLVNFIGF